MLKSTRKLLLLHLFWAPLMILACNFLSPGRVAEMMQTPAAPVEELTLPAPAVQTDAQDLLTVCMGNEPTSLFLYSDVSIAARSVRQAIYDGPFDTLGFENSPVILQEIPNSSNGGLSFEPVVVQPGNIVVDSAGNLVRLGNGVSYLPSGCMDVTCAQVYTGQDAVQLDQQVVKFKLRAGLLWSDGAPLAADDSRYSFEIASSLYPQARADLIARTQSYQALDQLTVEWRGVAGYRDAGYQANFFTPLPRHAWGSLPKEELLSSDLTNRQPLGWGAYRVEEWTSGDHISLTRNPNYFRSSEGLPHFERLVFRFISDGEQAVNALLAGECDYLDETLALEAQSARLDELQKAGQVAVSVEAGSAWEHLDFGMASLPAQAENALLPYFQLKEVRQAFALCIHRQRMVDEVFSGRAKVAESYLPDFHPLFNSQARRYAYDPQAGANLLENAGWKDADANPETPRLAQGVAGIPDGAPFEFAFLTTDEAEKRQVAQIVQESLAQCGVKAIIDSRPWDEIFASGPQGLVFGRNFSLAQFGWVASGEPPCFLYTTSQIPGPYPDFPLGWGGANVSGYSSPDFDRSCQQTRLAMPGTPERQAAHFQAQVIFAEDVPALPLYLRFKIVAMRTDLCGVVVDASTESALWNLERFSLGEECP